MNAIENQVRELVAVELSAANERFPQFHSAHEGYAVILEEAEELEGETDTVKETLSATWNFIKINEPKQADYGMKWVYRSAINAACEAIQVAAMCRKFMEMENRA